MTAQEILDEIRPLGTESYKNTIMRHGAQEPVFGVKIEELKKIQKRVKKDYKLALELYATGVYDAMYLAGLVADDAKMTKADLNRWVKGAYCHGLAEYTVAWVAAEGRFGSELGLEWIDSPAEMVATTGWSTLSGLVAIKPDAQLDMDALGKLLDRIGKTIHQAQNRPRYTMNGFVISVATYVAELSDRAIAIANKVGVVTVDMGGTACKVPFAPDMIAKCLARNAVGKKRKTVKC